MHSREEPKRLTIQPSRPVLLTSHRRRVDVERRLLEPRRNGDVVTNETGYVASHKYVVAEETAGTLHFRIVTLVHHCNTQTTAGRSNCEAKALATLPSNSTGAAPPPAAPSSQARLGFAGPEKKLEFAAREQTREKFRMLMTAVGNFVLLVFGNLSCCTQSHPLLTTPQPSFGSLSSRPTNREPRRPFRVDERNYDR